MDASGKVVHAGRRVRRWDDTYATFVIYHGTDE